MKQLLVSGLLYLIMIAILLIIKPKLMFREDGTWKEFGIGRNPNTHTWMPFWLFAILWAMISYIATSLLLGPTEDLGTTTKPTKPTRASRFIEDDADDYSMENFIKPKRKTSRRLAAEPMELPEGYYVLNAAATEKAGGVPKYVFLGKGLPEDS